MLYFFYGSDKDTAREKANALVGSLQKKKPDAELFRLTSETATGSALDELTFSQGLFHKTYVVYGTDLFENKEAKELILKRLDDLASSPNLFILLEGEVDKKSLLAIAEAAEKVQPYEKKAGKKAPEFNVFSLTDAFGHRDKRQLWVLLQKAFLSGAAPEEVHGILFWQLKSMLLVSASKTAEEAGVKPFVFSKAKSFSNNYSPKELKELSGAFVSMYHDAHRGIHDFEIALEKLALTL